MKIFINIASYRDSLLLDTINSAYENAYNKENLIFGIVEQETVENAINIDLIEFKNQIRYIRIDPVYARGPCWPRYIAQSLWKGEEYYLQIDSHMKFEADWDKILIEKYNELKKYHEKPIITMYLLRYSIEKTDNTTSIIKHDIDGCLGLVVDEKNAFSSDSDMYVGVRCNIINDKGNFIHGFMVSGHFLFSSGKIIEEVPYDPFLFFCGEEHSWALRLWTNGYNIFHTDIPIYHLYNTAEDNRLTLWGDTELENVRSVKWWEHDVESKKRLTSIVTGENLGIYGIGKIRTLQEYADFSGVDYLNKKIDEKAKTGEIVFALDYKNSINAENLGI